METYGAEAKRPKVSPPNCAPLRVSTTVFETLPCATLVSVCFVIRNSRVPRPGSSLVWQRSGGGGGGQR